MDAIIDFISSGRVIATAIIVAIVILSFIILKKGKDRYKAKHINDSTERATISRILFGSGKFIILLIGIFAILQANGINITAMMAGLGIASAIVGLALQDLLRDIIMGIHILSDHFFSMGEVVEYDGREGVIVGMTLKTTKIGDLDDHSITTVCNRNIEQIRRFGKRLDMDIPLPYSTSINDSVDAMREICRRIGKNDNVEKCDFEGTQNFNESSITYRMQIHCNPKDRADLRRFANLTVQEVLHEKGINIPFNQLDVHCDIIK